MELILTIPEIAALTRGGDARVQRVQELLGFDNVSNDVAQAGISSLYARGLIDGDGDDDIGPSQAVAAALGIIADSRSTLRMAVMGSDVGGTSHVHVVEGGGVIVTPVGFDCLHFSFIDVSGGLAAIVRTAGEAALGQGERILLVSVRTGDEEVSVAVRRMDDSFELSSSANGTYVTSADPWGDVAARLAA